MIELLVSLFLEQGLICTDEISAQQTANAIVHKQEFYTQTCGPVTGTVIEVRALPTLYVFPSGMGLRVVEGRYLGKTIYFFRMEYQI